MIRHSRRLGTLRGVVGGIVAAGVVVTLVVLGRLDDVERWSLDQLFELRGPRQPTAPIVIVTIDESSMSELDLQWPFPRTLHAQLLQRLDAGKPLAIGLDLIFDSPSSRSPADDEALGEAVAVAGNVVLGAAASVDVQAFYKRETLNAPIPVIRRGAAAVAAINLVSDADTHVRRAPLNVRVGDDSVPPFDVALYRLVQKAGLPAAPLPAGDHVLINFRGGPRTFPWVPYYRVINGEVPPESFRGKIVLIGPTSEVLHDVFPTAFARGGDMPGVEIHANMLDTYLRGNPLREVPRWISTLVAVLVAIAGSALVVRLQAVRALVAAVLLWIVLAAGQYAAFVVWDTWARGMAISLALVLGYGATVIERYVREQREKRRLARFFSPDVLEHVVRDRDATLSSSRRLVTIFFSDIRGFTSISEKLQPEQVAEMLKEYLSEMTEVVFRHGGTVDKYIGDCVMALYNVPFADPDHAVNAIRTALEFQERTLAVSRTWEARVGVTIRNGVGINTGEAVVGTLGSRQRLEYTAIGDAVNLAARLESITKDYGASIIISEFTYEYVKGRFLTRELGAVTVKGKTQPVRIYAVLPHDLRRHPRAIVDAAATVVALDAERECLASVVDVSRGGVALKGLPDDWEKGKTVEVRCAGGGLPKPVVAEGTIVWRRGEMAGVAFTSLLDEAEVPTGPAGPSQHSETLPLEPTRQ
jgi:adenylate cyclase